MTRRMPGRAAMVGALACGGLITGSATAGATPPADPGVSRHSIDYATVFVEENGVFSDFTVYAPEGAAPFARGEVFVDGYECLTEEDDLVPATIDPLTSATAQGTLELTCYWHGDWTSPEAPEVLQATAVVGVDLTWTAEGRTSRQTTAGPYSSCVTHWQIRHATVTGGLQVDIEALGVHTSATAPGDDDDGLQHAESICRPQR